MRGGPWGSQRGFDTVVGWVVLKKSMITGGQECLIFLFLEAGMSFLFYGAGALPYTRYTAYVFIYGDFFCFCFLLLFAYHNKRRVSVSARWPLWRPASYGHNTMRLQNIGNTAVGK